MSGRPSWARERPSGDDDVAFTDLRSQVTPAPESRLADSVAELRRMSLGTGVAPAGTVLPGMTLLGRTPAEWQRYDAEVVHPPPPWRPGGYFAMWRSTR